MTERSIVGDLINFRGLVYSPTNEDGVVFLFGKVVEDLNMYIEEIKPGFPDCVGRRFTGKGWEKVAIEFEYKSSNFKQHNHDPKGCDLVVCWEHDWPNCPVEVIELREIIKTLPSKPIQRPDAGIAHVPGTETTIEDHLKHFSDKISSLFRQLDLLVREISADIWSKVTGRPGVTYYSPERVFVYLRFQKGGLRLTVFTRGENIDGVKSFSYEKGGAKWGRIHIRDERDIKKTIPLLRRSYDLIKQAIKNNEPTGWYAELEDESEEAGDGNA